MSELLGADTDVLDRNADSLSADARRLQDLRTLAQRAVSELQGCWQGSDLVHLTALWEQQTSPLLAGASAALDTCAVQLRAQSTAQRAASDGGSRLSGGGYDGVLPPLLALPVTSPPPPGRGSPAGNATWWRSLTIQQQQEVTTLHPEWIGNRDGISLTARDQANRALLGVHHDRLESRKRGLEVSLFRDWTGGLPNSGVKALDQVRDKLASLEVIKATLALPGERQLLLLDLGSDRAEAAIANGDVQNADNVAVFVPGLSSNVTDSMKRYDQEMDELQGRAELESRNARANLSAATVTWIGYQAPQMGLALFGLNSVVSPHAAKNGAEKLVPFLQGVNAARSRDAHLTLLGHSYGSTTAGLALRQETGVDDAVLFGSPGFGTSHASDLKVGHVNAGTEQVRTGRLSYIEAQLDPVGDLGRFGKDPSLMPGIDHPSALESTVVDPLTGQVRHFKGVTGHGSYLANDSTSQYNIAAIMAGLPDRAVRSDGMDVGDVLRLAAGMAVPVPPILSTTARFPTALPGLP